MEVQDRTKENRRELQDRSFLIAGDQRESNRGTGQETKENRRELQDKSTLVSGDQRES